jgi:hypothetical protein
MSSKNSAFFDRFNVPQGNWDDDGGGIFITPVGSAAA